MARTVRVHTFPNPHHYMADEGQGWLSLMPLEVSSSTLPRQGMDELSQVPWLVKCVANSVQPTDIKMALGGIRPEIATWLY